jgi:hypothetical protein
VTILDAQLTAPGAPQNLVATPGNGSASFTFSPPASNGGTAITSYAVTCTPGPFSNSAASSPVSVSGLTNGTTYTCSVTATNAVGTGPASSTVQVTPAAFSLTSAASRHTHGLANQDISIALAQPILGNVTVEPRDIGAGHKILFTFPVSVSSGTVSCKDEGNANVGTCGVSFFGSVATVNISAMPDAQRVTVTLANVNGVGVNAGVSILFLKGDVDGTRSVTASDILAAKGKMGQAVGSGTFRNDVDVNNAINATDVTVIKGNSGLSP